MGTDIVPERLHLLDFVPGEIRHLFQANVPFENVVGADIFGGTKKVAGS